MSQTNETDIDVKKIVTHFGGRQALANKLKNAGSDIANVRVIDGWLFRGRVPSNRLLEIARVAAAENRRFDILQFQVK